MSGFGAYLFCGGGRLLRGLPGKQSREFQNPGMRAARCLVWMPATKKPGAKAGLWSWCDFCLRTRSHG